MTDLSNDSFRWDFASDVHNSSNQFNSAPIGTRISRACVYMSVFAFNAYVWYALLNWALDRA